MCLLIPSAFTSHWYVLGLSVSAFTLLLFTYRKKMLAAIHKVKRNSVGSVLFPVPVYACFLLATLEHNMALYYIPISLLAISDTAAELGGQQWGYRTRKFFNGQKSLAGALSFFLTALPVSAGWLYFGYDLSSANVLLVALVLSMFTCIAELVTLHGWDNLSVPAIALVILAIMT